MNPDEQPDTTGRTTPEEPAPLQNTTPTQVQEVPEPAPMQPSDGSAPQKERNKALRWMLYGGMVLLLIGFAVAGYVLFKSLTAPVQKSTLKVGVLMAFTGGSSNMGYGTMKGITLAKEQLGADSIELLQEDSKCEPNTARDAAQRLIDQGVVAIIGDGCSSASVAALPLANNSKTVMISPSASSTSLTIPNDYFFRVIPNDNYQAQFMAQEMRDQGIMNVAIMYTNEPYGSSMNKVFKEKFETLGGKVVATAFSEPDVIDLREQMQTLKNANPQAVFIAPNSVVTATAAIKVAREVGIAAPLFGADIMYDETIITNAPEAAEGLKVSTFSTGTSIFKQMLLNKYKAVEQLYAAPQAYDAFEVIYRAAEQGATTGEQIKDYLPSVEFEGMSGHIKFDQNGEIIGQENTYDLIEIKNGEFSVVE